MSPTPTTVRMRPDQPGAAVARALIALKESGGSPGLAAEFAARAPECRSTPHVAKHLEFKAAVAAGTAGSVASPGHYLGDVDPLGIGREFFQLLQSASIFGRLTPSLRRIEFRTPYPTEVGGGAGSAWRGEGQPFPLMRSTTDKMTLDHFEAVTDVVVTKEVLRFGAIAEKALTDICVAGVAKFLDQQLLDTSVTASSAHPASITSGASSLTSSGSSAANIITDLTALIAAITTPGDALRWVMRPLTLATINGRLAGVGYPTLPNMLLGIPVIAGSTSPQQIVLLDANAFAYASDDAVGLDVATHASIEMSDSPTQDAVAGTGAQLVSLFQVGAVAIRASLGVSWQATHYELGSPSQPSGIAVMPVTY